MMLPLTRDPVTSFGFSLSFIGWWGWPFWVLNVFPSLNLVSAVLLLTVIPISISLAVGVLLSTRTKLGLRSSVYASITAYYIVGTTYFVLSRTLWGRAPDVAFEIALPLWLLILLASVLISSRVAERVVK
ncbi:MAG: hypothetical protein QW080_00450 [Sulfolobales archaeon]